MASTVSPIILYSGEEEEEEEEGGIDTEGALRTAPRRQDKEKT
jgi:hypothetical protein